MDLGTQNWMMVLLQTALSGVGAWAAVKVELRYLQMGVKHVSHGLEKVNERVDDHLTAHADK